MTVENVKFLKNEYGIGGAYPAVRDKNLDEWHDSKGIRISTGSIANPDATVTLTWKKVEKRIRELMEVGRYLSPAEKEKYPAYRRDRERREARWKIAENFRSIVYDYNDFLEQLGESGKQLNLNYLSSYWGAFGSGQKKMYARTGNGDYILPMMREAMQTIIGDNTHLTERCETMLACIWDRTMGNL